MWVVETFFSSAVFWFGLGFWIWLWVTCFLGVVIILELLILLFLGTWFTCCVCLFVDLVFWVFSGLVFRLFWVLPRCLRVCDILGF